MRLSIVCLIAAATVSATASTAAADCFRLSEINAHSIADNKTMYLSVGRKDVYKVSMKGACLGGAMSSDPIITESFGGGPICRPIDLNLKIANGVGESACIVDKFEKLTPEQIAAIPKKQRP
jgi:Family of unknown function (DUF6491)